MTTPHLIRRRYFSSLFLGRPPCLPLVSFPPHSWRSNRSVARCTSRQQSKIKGKAKWKMRNEVDLGSHVRYWYVNQATYRLQVRYLWEKPRWPRKWPIISLLNRWAGRCITPVVSLLYWRTDMREQCLRLLLWYQNNNAANCSLHNSILLFCAVCSVEAGQPNWQLRAASFVVRK